MTSPLKRKVHYVVTANDYDIVNEKWRKIEGDLQLDGADASVGLVAEFITEVRFSMMVAVVVVTLLISFSMISTLFLLHISVEQHAILHSL